MYRPAFILFLLSFCFTSVGALACILNDPLRASIAGIRVDREQLKAFCVHVQCTVLSPEDSGPGRPRPSRSGKDILWTNRTIKPNEPVTFALISDSRVKAVVSVNEEGLGEIDIVIPPPRMWVSGDIRPEKFDWRIAMREAVKALKSAGVVDLNEALTDLAVALVEPNKAVLFCANKWSTVSLGSRCVDGARVTVQKSCR